MDTQRPPRRILRAAVGCAGASFLALAFAATPAAASGTRAGTVISNTATATWGSGDETSTATSNTVDFRVDEILDVAVASRDGGDATVAAGARGVLRSFTVTNAGNGPEAFVLDARVAPGGGFTPTVTGLAIDRDGDGVYDAAIDALVANGATSALLDPDAAITVFVLSDVAADAADAARAEVRLTATAATGSGTPGTVFASMGEDGGDAIVGATHATARDAGGLVLSRGTVRFTKSATIADPFGTARAVPGAVITYRLVAAVSGSGSIAGLRVADAIPGGTTLQPGTLTLDGARLTDAADADAGTADASGIAVTLGDVPAGREHAVTFAVRIN